MKIPNSLREGGRDRSQKSEVGKGRRSEGRGLKYLGMIAPMKSATLVMDMNFMG